MTQKEEEKKFQLKHLIQVSEIQFLQFLKKTKLFCREIE